MDQDATRPIPDSSSAFDALDGDISLLDARDAPDVITPSPDADAADASAPDATPEHGVKLFDTAWSLAAKSTPAQLDVYFQHLSHVGFSGVWINLFPWKLDTQNRAGETIGSIGNPSDGWLSYIDVILDKAASNQLVVGLVVCWANSYAGDAGGWQINPQNGRSLGARIGARWRSHPALAYWIMGGDYSDEGSEAATGPTWEAVVEGLVQDGGVDRSSQPISYHTGANPSSHMLFLDAWWLDFASIQTGHCAGSKAKPWLENVIAETNKDVWAAEMRYEAFNPSWCDVGTISPAMCEEDAQTVLDVDARALVFGHNQRWNWSSDALASLGSPGEKKVLARLGLGPN